MAKSSYRAQKRIESRSDAQKDVENYMFKQLQEEFGDIKQNERICLDEDRKVYIRPDFFSESGKIIGEIHAHIGRLKPAQHHKIAADALKMLLFDGMHGGEFRKYIAVCDEEEEKQLTSDSYLAMALSHYQIKVIPIIIPAEMRQRLCEAMKRQDMTKGS